MTAGKNANSIGSRLINPLGVLSIAGLVYCLAAYLYLRQQLTPAMPDPTPAVELIGALALPALAVAGIYHLVLLVRAFQILAGMPAGRLLHSVFLAAVVLSGLSLATEPVQLSEIGKEYALFDVGGQWWFLIGSTLFHLAVVTAGFFHARRVAGGLSAAVRNIDSRSDAFFVTMHQVGFLCGLLGILGVMSYTHWGVLERYRAFLILLLSVLALVPWGTILAFLMVRNRNKPLSAWFDEKQTTDTAVGGLCSMMVVMPILVILSAVDLRIEFQPPFAFWLMLLFFLCLTLFSFCMLMRSRADGAKGSP
jgi:hypothetical protein